MYALLAETVPARRPPAKEQVAFEPSFAAAMLAETPSVTVPSDTLTRFGAHDFPLLLVADPTGTLRVMEPVSAQTLEPGGDIDAAIALVGRNFSPKPSPTPTEGSHVPRP